METELVSAFENLDALVAAAIPRGRRASAEPTVVRELTAEDHARIPSRPGAEIGLIKTIRHTHHLAAKLLAEGRSAIEVAAITGYTPARVQQFRHDPMFNELVQHYEAAVDAQYLNVHERLAALGVALTDELMERFEKIPESFDNAEVRKLLETVMDRSGFGPTSKIVTHNTHLHATAQIVERVKREHEARGEVRRLDHQRLLPAAE